MPNRNQAPTIKLVEALDLTHPAVHYLDNGIPVYELNMGTQEVIKLEIVFDAGRPYEEKKLAARSTVAQLKEGSKNYSAHKLAEHLDFFGSSVNIPFSLDVAQIVIYSLTRHFGDIIPVVAEMLSTPTFPQEELNSFIRRNQQRLQVDLSKNDVIAYRTLTEYIFGSSHPYGYNSFPETYGELDRADLVEHFRKCYTSGNCSIFVSGKTNDNILKAINSHLGQAVPEGKLATPALKVEYTRPQQIRIDNPGTVQSAIRIGCHLFSRKHPDYIGLYILNTIFGGYFGSRLMHNIREDKGYTYNIYSMLDALRWDGSFYISTEVGTEFVKPTLKEIYKEMALLQQEQVSQAELEITRNFLLGHFLGMLDGPFNVSEVSKMMVLDKLPFSHFAEFIEKIKTISPQEIQDLAQKYLDKEKMWEIVVG